MRDCVAYALHEKPTQEHHCRGNLTIFGRRRGRALMMIILFAVASGRS